MVAIKAHQAQTFLAAPNPNLNAYLFFGTDPGLVSERARLLTELLAKKSTPPSEVIRLDDSDLETDPDRLSVEVQTVPMFGGEKIVRLRQGRRINSATLRPLLTNECRTSILVVESGNLRPSDGLRSLFEKSKTAAAVACYGDTGQDLENLINRVLTKSQQTITMDAREMLIARLGADHALSIGELEKLTLYTTGRPKISADDVEAIVGDASELTLDKIVFAAAAGHPKRALAELSRAIASGETAHAVIAALQRHFHRLLSVRATIDTGRRIDDAIKQLKPQIHFKQKTAFTAQLQKWRHDGLLQAIARIAATAKTVRTAGPLEKILVERLLIRLTQLARSSAR